MAKAVFAGSFDPVTYGHLDIIERSSPLFEEIDVVIAVNSEKKYTFTLEERLEMLKSITKKFKNVSVHTCDHLIVDYAKENGANILLRGVRNGRDFDYEFDLALLNHNLSSEIQTLFIPTSLKYTLIRSSSIKELAKFGGDISKMVPPEVEKALKEKFSKK